MRLNLINNIAGNRLEKDIIEMMVRLGIPLDDEAKERLKYTLEGVNVTIHEIDGPEDWISFEMIPVVWEQGYFTFTYECYSLGMFGPFQITLSEVKQRKPVEISLQTVWKRETKG